MASHSESKTKDLFSIAQNYEVSMGTNGLAALTVAATVAPGYIIGCVNSIRCVNSKKKFHLNPVLHPAHSRPFFFLLS